jgi:ferrous iron transport protein B
LKKIGFANYPIICSKYSGLTGTYSLNASSIDENVVIELLLNKKR